MASDQDARDDRLDEFLYTVSHDLGAPLRKMIAFSELLERKHGDALGPEGRKYLDYVVSNGRRMREMLNALLRLSRIETDEQRLAPIDPADVVRLAARRLRPSIEDVGGTLTVDGMPSIQGDSAQLSALFGELLSNAVRFRSPDRPLAVHVAGRSMGDWVELTVRDNGIGFRPQDVPRMLVVFGTLEAPSQAEGLGMGLPLAKRLTERNGGEFSIEGEPDLGAVVRLKLHAAAG